jgi:hypothetical protein
MRSQLLMTANCTEHHWRRNLSETVAMVDGAAKRRDSKLPPMADFTDGYFNGVSKNRRLIP